MNILSKQLRRIARELSNEEFKEQYGISIEDYGEAVDNPIYGFLIFSKAISSYFAYCSDNRYKVSEVGSQAVAAIRHLPGNELVEVLDGLATESGIEEVGEMLGNLFYIHSRNRSFVAKINGKYRLVNVVGKCLEDF